MGDRGFACVSLFNPKTPANVGGVLRACDAFGVAQVTLSGTRGAWIAHGTNTTRAERHMPVIVADDPLAAHPHGVEVVAVDLVEGARPLPRFHHPDRALYVFGPEDGTLGRSVLDRAHHRLMVPTRRCLNLASCVCVVLYDRAAKRGEHGMMFPRQPALEGVSA